jgi:hypothetical protein
MPCWPGSCSTALASSDWTGPMSSGDKLPMATVSPCFATTRQLTRAAPGPAVEANAKRPCHCNRQLGPVTVAAPARVMTSNYLFVQSAGRVSCTPLDAPSSFGSEVFGVRALWAWRHARVWGRSEQ